MTSIGLRFEVFDHKSIRYGTESLPVTRVVVDVRFEERDGSLSRDHQAAVDTGAYITVVPRYVWRPVERRVLTRDVFFGGVKQTKRCQVRADLALVTCVLSDREGRETPPIPVPAYLAHSDRVPLLIGFADLLARYRMLIDPTTGEAWLREGKGVG